jgi:pantoate--beta-alanine ligase
MDTVTSIIDVRRKVAAARKRGLSIGFVPTMGDLHAGHMALVAAARKETDFVVVSVFVNPTQFGPGEDYERYTRNLPRDTELCKQAGVNLLFAPTVKDMYPEENLTWVTVEKLTEPLCGQSRPGHFRGVATVCTKLFGIVRPDAAFFGRKDAQQSIVIQRMVRDLNLPLHIVVCPTVREPDGLAMSSRNRYLTPDLRQDAAILYAALKQCSESLLSGGKEPDMLEKDIRNTISKTPSAQIEYIGIMNAETLQPAARIEGDILVALAVRFGATRLIDNLVFDASKRKISL